MILIMLDDDNNRAILPWEICPFRNFRTYLSGLTNAISKADNLGRSLCSAQS
jgi:hypothetical protein